MSADEVYEWLGRLRLRRSEQDLVAGAVTLGPLLAQRLGGTEPVAPSALFEQLSGQAVEVLLMAALLAPQDSPVADRIETYLERIRDVRLEIGGEDLKQAGVPESPALGRALQQTLALKLDGFVSGRDEELRAALRILDEDRT
jgi:tRNA nucleotidyltransferase (CCA-adding enzyme)